MRGFLIKVSTLLSSIGKHAKVLGEFVRMWSLSIKMSAVSLRNTLENKPSGHARFFLTCYSKITKSPLK